MQGWEAGSVAREMVLNSFKLQESSDSSCLVGSPVQRTQHQSCSVAAHGGSAVHRYPGLSREDARAQYSGMLKPIISVFLVWLTQGDFDA